MAENVKPIFLNLGSGKTHIPGYINVDNWGDPDIKHDLNVFPWPWDDNSVDGIVAYHVFEHLDNWWKAFEECVRILKFGGTLEMRVPDESSSSALTYRDHHHIFNLNSFHGIHEANHGTNAWAEEVRETIPFKLESYYQVPFKKYYWMLRFPRILRFCANHLRNFIHEQRILFRKVGL